MPDIGVRELKIHASEIIRQVREAKASYVVTYRGQPVGVLLPYDEANVEPVGANPNTAADVWEELTRLGDEIAQGWPAGKTSAEVISGMRR